MIKTILLTIILWESAKWLINKIWYKIVNK